MNRFRIHSGNTQFTDVNFEKIPRGILGDKEAGSISKKSETLLRILERQEQAAPEDLEAELNDIPAIPPAVVMPSIDPVDEVRPEDAQAVAHQHS